MIAVGLFYSLHGPFYLLLFYLWNAYFRPELWVWYDFVSPLRLSFTLGIGLAAAVVLQVRRVRWNLRLLLMVLFFGQCCVSLYEAENPEWSWNYWIEFSKVFLVSCAISVLVTNLQRYRITLLVIAYSIGLEAAKQGWAQMILNPGAQNVNQHPVLGDNNGVGFGMMMIIPVFVALARTANARSERFVHWFFVIGLFYRGISTYSRGAFLSAGVLGAILLWRSQRRLPVLAVVALLSILTVNVMPDQFWERMRSINAPAEDRDQSQQGRLYFWGVAFRMAESNPLKGVGFNGYRPAFARYDPSGGQLYGEDRAVHSAWFGVLAELGYPGFVLFVVLLLSTLMACGRMRRAYKQSQSADAKALAVYATALETSLLVYAVGVTFLNGQYNEMYWHFLGLSLALQTIAVTVSATQERRDVNAAVTARFATVG
jgi:probable O-glycosylation ligase (exosortase A-associated)